MKKREKIWTSLDDHFFPLFSHFLKSNPYSRKPNSFISYIQSQFLAIHSTRLDSCVNTVGCSIERSDNVGRSHEVKKMIGRVLGYNVDAGIRSAAWKSIKPYTFYPHKLVVMVNKHPNLQIWGVDLNTLRTHTVVEIFGDYWHSKAKTGKERSVHKQEVIAFYKRANVRCLVIWESEVNKHPKRVSERIAKFLGIN